MTKHLLIFDGECGMCRRTVNWIARRDRRREFEAVPFQTAPMTPALRAQCKKAVHVIKPNGEILRAGRAVLYILERINWGGFLPGLFSRAPLIWFVEIGYKVVAANRNLFSKFLFTRGETGEIEKGCQLPEKQKASVRTQRQI